MSAPRSASPGRWRSGLRHPRSSATSGRRCRFWGGRVKPSSATGAACAAGPGRRISTTTSATLCPTPAPMPRRSSPTATPLHSDLAGRTRRSTSALPWTRRAISMALRRTTRKRERRRRVFLLPRLPTRAAQRKRQPPMRIFPTTLEPRCSCRSFPTRRRASTAGEGASRKGSSDWAHCESRIRSAQARRPASI